MSRTFKVDVYTSAYATVHVKISDDRLQEIADNIEKPVGNLTTEDLIDEITETYETPTLCAHCTGYGKNFSLDLSDQWDFSTVPDESVSSAITEIVPEES
jgi:hypothetical protein